MNNGYFGQFGGAYVAQPIASALKELEEGFNTHYYTEQFQRQLKYYQEHFVGRPTMITHLATISRQLGGAQIYCKREDMTNVGAHKINHALVQGLLAKAMGKTELIAETGAGMHGVSTAIMGAQLGLKVTVFMGAEDIARQYPNVQRMKLFGAEVVSVESGSKTLKDAVNEAMKYWISNLEQAAYVLGSALGPHPYPSIVRISQEVVGQECLTQFLELSGHKYPDYVVACVGGGCNSIGIFAPYIAHEQVKLVGVEAGGSGTGHGQHACRFDVSESQLGIFQGYKSYFLQDDYGNISPTHSISAGLDYPGIGPEHAYLRETGRVQYLPATDKEVLEAVVLTTQQEGILPALESAHALAYAYKLAPTLSPDQTILVNVSGRGDKDLHTILDHIQL